MNEEEDVVTVDADEIRDILSHAVVMPPVTAIGAHISTGLNPNLIIEEEVTTVEFLTLTPSPDGDTVAIFTLVMEPVLAESLGLTDTKETV